MNFKTSYPLVRRPDKKAPTAPAFLTHTAVARKLWPGLPPRTARRYLRLTIDEDPDLRRRLYAAGYRRGCRRLTPRMLRIIYQELKSKI